LISLFLFVAPSWYETTIYFASWLHTTVKSESRCF